MDEPVASLTVDHNTLVRESKLFGKDLDEAELTSYHKAMNEAALQLCTSDASLLKNRGRLLDLARKKLHDSGYVYAKKTTRSKVLGADTSPDLQQQPPKRVHMTHSVRQKKIKSVEEDLDEINKQIHFAEKAREKHANVKQYQSASGLCEEIRNLRGRKRTLTDELTLLQRKVLKSAKNKEWKATQKNKIESNPSKTKAPRQSGINMFLRPIRSATVTSSDTNQNEAEIRDTSEQCAKDPMVHSKKVDAADGLTGKEVLDSNAMQVSEISKDNTATSEKSTSKHTAEDQEMLSNFLE